MPKLGLDGIFIPIVTPFTSNGRLDTDSLKTCLEFWHESGVAGLVPCGSNGEAPYLSKEERIDVIKTVMDETAGKTSIIAGTGSMSTQETIMFTKDAKDLGVDAALVVTPFYYKLSSREICEHYRKVSEAVDLPIVIYNVPKFTGVSVEPQTVYSITTQCRNIVAVKDSTGNLGTITETVRLVGNTISVLAGTAELALPTLMLGGKGAIIAVANVFPELCMSMYEAFKLGNHKEASRLQTLISFANEVLVRRHNQLSAIKEALRLLGLPAGLPRRPALPLENGERKEVEDMLKSLQPLLQHLKEY